VVVADTSHSNGAEGSTERRSGGIGGGIGIGGGGEDCLEWNCDSDDGDSVRGGVGVGVGVDDGSSGGRGEMVFRVGVGGGGGGGGCCGVMIGTASVSQALGGSFASSNSVPPNTSGANTPRCSNAEAAEILSCDDDDDDDDGIRKGVAGSVDATECDMDGFCLIRMYLRSSTTGISATSVASKPLDDIDIDIDDHGIIIVVSSPEIAEASSSSSSSSAFTKEGEDVAKLPSESSNSSLSGGGNNTSSSQTSSSSMGGGRVSVSSPSLVSMLLSSR